MVRMCAVLDFLFFLVLKAEKTSIFLQIVPFFNSFCKVNKHFSSANAATFQVEAVVEKRHVYISSVVACGKEMPDQPHLFKLKDKSASVTKGLVKAGYAESRRDVPLKDMIFVDAEKDGDYVQCLKIHLFFFFSSGISNPYFVR